MSDRSHGLTSVEREALSWYLRIQDPNLPLAEWHLWRQWHAIEAHRKAFRQVAVDFERWRRLWQLPAYQQDATPRQSKLGRRFMWCAAAVMALVAFLLWGSAAHWQTDALRTGGNGRTIRTLEDGSAVTLRSDARLITEFNARSRIVHLIEGEAAFDVAKDSQRPFTVQTNLVDAQAVGTRFSVSIQNDEAVVTVSEGTVAVHWPSTQRSNSLQRTNALLLQAGEQIQVSPSFFRLMPKLNARRRPAWVDGWFDLSGATADEAVAEFNRRHATQLELVNAPAAVAGYFWGHVPSDAPEIFAQTIANLFCVSVIVHPPRQDDSETSHAVMPTRGCQLRPAHP